MQECIAARLTIDLLQPVTVFRLDDVPARRVEECLQPSGANARHDPVKALPVQVDDPEHVAEPAERLLGHGLPDVPFVQFGITDK